MTVASYAGKFRVAQPIEQAFPLFSPRGEEAWAPGWKPEILYAPLSDWEEGMVFRTVRDGQETIWFVAKLDREAHHVTYHRVDAGTAAVTVDVACEPAGAQTIVRVRYTFVALSDEGAAQIASRNQGEFDQWMEEWEKAIAAI
ncbi:MAG TPA: hypothetical protein VGF69_04060 [Thermoanaerobaculia bacterium]|jgi:hypothetical protein